VFFCAAPDKFNKILCVPGTGGTHAWSKQYCLITYLNSYFNVVIKLSLSLEYF
jgi:hypothetical protein